MIYRFGDYSLDARRHELRRGGETVPIEPQVMALLRLLIDNRDRLVTRDEIIESVWNGRIVSEAAISSRIKSARQAIGDDGAAQRLIRTMPKLGFRFVGEVEAPVEPRAAVAEAPDEAHEPAARPSIAVLPFETLGAAGPLAGLGEALPHDLIAALSRLRWLFVIARGSSFQFRGERARAETVRAALNVDYLLSGTVETAGARMIVTVELCDTRTGGVVWGERFSGPLESVHEVREQILEAVIGALELQITLNEATRARLAAPANLDAWSAYHLGLHQMYRFSPDGTARAQALFEQAIAREPTFARAHAALSFTHFENAFLSFADDAGQAADQARRFAEQGLDHDPLDPFCNLVMGRVYWLGGDLEASLPWLDRAVRLNPNYAQGKYSRAWAESLMGQADTARADVDGALRLSPVDPLAYGMLGVRA
ncbi:MAG TPA: winged helix-turn-helix domain-containing protein, partial [Caulobacteraceae bacterium]